MHKENNGLAVLNGNCADFPQKTVIVLGVPRGGTSMVAGTLAKLGVFMGKHDKHEPFYENSCLGICSKQKDRKKAKSIIDDFNCQYPVWGMKILPKSWVFWLWKGLFRDPVYIVVFRDVLAIAKRQVVSMDKSLLKEILIAIWYNFCLLTFLAVSKRPAFIISYEKALLFPESFVEELSLFLGINDPARLTEACQFISPSPAIYLMRSTTHCQLNADVDYFGYLDTVEPSNVAGWVLSLADELPMKIELLVNGVHKQFAEASLPRKDVQDRDTRFRENCGFAFNLAEGEKLHKGDCVEVRLVESHIHLINSPFWVS